MVNKRNKNPTKTRLIAIASLTFVIFLMVWFSNYPKLVERYYSEGFYRAICWLLHPLLNLFPFSVGDVLYILVIAYLIYASIRLIKLAFKKQFEQAGFLLLGITIGTETGILIFYLFWGLNYFRPSAGELLNLRNSNFTTADLKKVTGILIDSANATRAAVMPSDLLQSNTAIYVAAKQAVINLKFDSVHFHTYSPDIKSSILTALLNYMGTSGYYNPFTSEAQINYQMPVFNRPVVACHEMSHQMGFGAEDEADFVGYLAGIGSHNRLLRYSAYHLAVEEFMYSLRSRDTTAFKELRTQISVPVHNDFKADRLYWQAYQSQINRVSSIFYDKFLKVNNQPKGLETYNQMVLLVMALYKRGS